MTIIAYRDGVLAADSLKTCGSTRASYNRKIKKIGNVLVGGAGNASLAERFFDWVQKGLRGESPYDPVGADGNGIIVRPDGLILCFGTGGPQRYIWPYFAIGSGESVAIGAFEMGATAEEAVKIAIRIDVYCGGEVVSVRF